MTNDKYIVVVADDVDGHALNPKVFIANGMQGVNYGRNIWHGVLTPIIKQSVVAAVDYTGAVIRFMETHVMEHGLYVLEGKGVYKLNQDWVEVEAGDYMWLRAYCPQACYSGGDGTFRDLLYKDVNRHMTFPTR